VDDERNKVEEVNEQPDGGSIMDEIVGPPMLAKSVREVRFYGDTIIAVVLEDDSVCVPIRPITNALGLSFSGQRQRILRDDVLAEAAVNILANLDDGQSRTMLALPLELLPGFLFGISAKRVKLELQDRVLLYKRRCHIASWEDVRGELGLASPAPVGLSGAEMALQIAQATAHLARQQIEFESRLTGVEGKRASMADFIRDFIVDTRQQLRAADERLTILELRLDPKNQITTEQRAQIMIADRNLAHLLEESGADNGYSKPYQQRTASLT